MRIRSLLFCLISVICVAAVFSHTFVSEKTVSRFALINKLDALFNSQLQGENISVAEDPSACLQSIPRGFFLQNSLLRHESVLWNPLCGCGQPFLADPANVIWNPIDLVFAPTKQKAYGLGIVLKIVIGALFSYLLCLKNKASPWAASISAIGFALSPRILSSTELATNFEMIPALFLAFSCYKPGDGLLKTLLFALLIAFSYLCLHPEVFFISVLSCSALWLFSLWDCAISLRLSSLLKLGLFSVALVSPFLFPFLEYMQYAHSYKFNDSSIQFIAFSDLLSYLCNPKLHNSLFPGILTLIGLVPGIIYIIRNRPALLFVLASLLVFACRPYPLNELLSIAPVSYLLPEYALGPALLLACVASSLGLSEFGNRSNRFARRFFFFILGIASLLASLLYLWRVPHYDAPLSSKYILLSLGLAFISGLIILAYPTLQKLRALRFRQRALVYGFLVILPLLNTGTMLAPARAALPANDLVSLPPASGEELIDTLCKLGNSRIAACGTGLFVPETNLFYGLNDMRTCSPLNNSFYLKFIEKMGGRLGYCNMIELPAHLNRLLDIASVSYLVSAVPIHSSAELAISGDSNSARQTAAGHLLPGLRLLKSEAAYNADSAEMDVSLLLRAHQNIALRYKARLVLLNGDSRLWQSQLFDLNPSQQHCLQIEQSVPVPSNESKKRFSLVLLILDTWSGREAELLGQKLELLKGGLRLLEIEAEPRSQVKSPDKRFVLMHESPRLFRIYRNMNACPRAYLVGRIYSVKTAEDALNKLLSAEFSPGQEAVVESERPLVSDLTSLQSKPSYRLTFLNNSNTEIELDCLSSHPAWLVLSDLFYPGWTCRVDGRESRIFRANFMFRGVKLPAGRHLITFAYRPNSFLWGSILSLTTTALLLCLVLNRLYLSRNHRAD